MAGEYRTTLRIGSEVERARFDGLGAAIDAVERRLREVARDLEPFVREMYGRVYEPVQQVAARAEIAVPRPRRVRAGVDLRGDGSAEAWTGRLRRQVVDQQPGEDAYAALRRVLA